MKTTLNFAALLSLFIIAGVAECGQPGPDGWTTSSPRDEIRPAFSWERDGGPDGNGVLTIASDDREGLMGHWRKSFPVEGGRHYRFSSWRRTENLDVVREHRLTAYPVQDIADIEADPHWQAMRLTVDVPDGEQSIRMHNVAPSLSATPGRIRWPGPSLGAHNDSVYIDELGLSRERLAELKNAGVI